MFQFNLFNMRLTTVGTLVLLAIAPATSSFAQKQKTSKAKQTKSAKTEKVVTTTAPQAPQIDNTPIITLGKHVVPVSEFSYVYKKNNERSEDAYSEASVKEYVDLYTNFKLKVIDAQNNGEDTVAAYRNELETYRKQLAAPYLTEKSVTEKLLREAYNRFSEEVNASHILISVGPDADRKDTLAAYNKLLSILNRANSGEKFEKLAREFSEDPSAKENGGNLGYFTALQMVYPFEEAAFKTPKGKISNIIRTRFGYHILKVNDRRPSKGKVRAAHIMVRTAQGESSADSIAARKKIFEIYEKLKKGEDWNTLCNQFSDDPGSKEKNGELPEFGVGQMIPEFEEAAFKLEKANEYSLPFKTGYGWHIIKLIEKVKLKPYEEMEPDLKQRVSRDSRSELNQTLFLAKIRKENELKEFPAILKQAQTKADTALIKARFKFNETDTKLNSQVLFTIKGQPYTIGAFFKYVTTAQQEKNSTDPAFVMENYYKAFVNKSLLEYEEAHLEDKHYDYKMLLKEYKEGILLFSQMDKKVWTKAIEDTTGLKAFYEENKGKYRWGQRVKAVIYNAENQQTLEEVKTKLAQGSFLVSDPKFDNLQFEKNAVKLPMNARNVFAQIVAATKRDKNITIEVVGHIEGKEKSSVSKKRAQLVIDSLVARGVNKNSIKLVDAGKTQQLYTKAEENQRVTFRVYNSSPKALERVMNATSALRLKVTEGYFEKGNNADIDKVTWKVGKTELPADKGRISYIEVLAVEEPRNKTLDEARGAVITDYQNELEKQWIASLKKKYPVTINEVEVKKLIKK